MKKYHSLQRKLKIEWTKYQVLWKCSGNKEKKSLSDKKCLFSDFQAEIRFSSWREKVTSWAEPSWNPSARAMAQASLARTHHYLVVMHNTKYCFIMNRLQSPYLKNQNKYWLNSIENQYIKDGLTYFSLLTSILPGAREELYSLHIRSYMSMYSIAVLSVGVQTTTAQLFRGGNWKNKTQDRRKVWKSRRGK